MSFFVVSEDTAGGAVLRATAGMTMAKSGAKSIRFFIACGLALEIR
jgi:hypothetical protein